MLRRKTYILPLCFACFMLIAHIAVPHHHHNGTVICLLNFSSEIIAEPHCFAVHHHNEGVTHDGTPHEGCHSGENHGCSHHGDENSSEENCCIDDLYLISETKYSIDLETFLDDQNYTLGIFEILVLSSNDKIISTGLPFRQNPFILSYNSPLISGDSGLRGPPVG